MTTDPNRGQYGPSPAQGQAQSQGQAQGQGQLPPPQQWAPPPSGYSYPDPQHQYPYHYPPPQPHEMHQQPLQPQHPDPFRALPPPMGYPYPPMDAYRQPPPQQYQAPAPRQRTAIACRYCRRRKIRCSGYEGENGKCSNCVRFGQECLFTPVSSSAQAFVPAHVAFPQLRNQGGGAGVTPGGGRPPQLYGAHGQPLPPDYGKPSGTDQQQSYAPPPNSAPYYPQYPPTSAPYDSRGAAGGATNEPPNPDRREPVTSPYSYPDPTGQNLAPVSPATSVSSYQTGPSQGYYPSAPPSQRRSSPQSAHSFDNRASDSPRGSTTALASSQGQSLPGRTPPPVSGAGGGLPAMSVAGMLGGPAGSSPGDASRSTHDNNMLNALDRRNRGSGDERK